MTKKILFLTISLFFSTLTINAFEPEQFIEDEFFNIRSKNCMNFYYYYKNIDESILNEIPIEIQNDPTSIIMVLYINLFKIFKNENFKQIGGKPQSIEEAKLCALVIWQMSEYQCLSRNWIGKEAK